VIGGSGTAEQLVIESGQISDGLQQQSAVLSIDVLQQLKAGAQQNASFQRLRQTTTRSSASAASWAGSRQKGQ